MYIPPNPPKSTDLLDVEDYSLVADHSAVI